MNIFIGIVLENDLIRHEPDKSMTINTKNNAESTFLWDTLQKKVNKSIKPGTTLDGCDASFSRKVGDRPRAEQTSCTARACEDASLLLEGTQNIEYRLSTEVRGCL